MFLPKVKRKGRTFIGFRIKELNSVGGGGGGGDWVSHLPKCGDWAEIWRPS